MPGFTQLTNRPGFGRRVAAAVSLPVVAAVATLGLTATHADASTKSAPAQGKVVARTALTAHTAPSTHAGANGSYKHGKVIGIDCKMTGTSVGGNKVWYKVHGEQRWVSARYVANQGAAPRACYLHMGSHAKTTAALSVRKAPTTHDAKSGSLKKGQKVTVWCKVTSQSIHGDKTWYYGAKEVKAGNTTFGWISGKYVKGTHQGESLGYTCNFPTPR